MIASEAARKHLRLALVPEIGPIRFRRLLDALGNIDEVLSAPISTITRIEGFGSRIAEELARHRESEEQTAAELQLCEQHGVRVICQADEEYPPTLTKLPDPPICLYVKGQLTRQDILAVAVVGSRRPSQYGREQAGRFGYLLAQAGITVVSGLARGVDAASHRGALTAGGRTIAVLGNGLASIYPPENAELAEQVVQYGALLSELPMTAEPDPGHFPMRNRIIAGVAHGVLVVEGTKKSGALITARLATEYNREVFAVPGRVDVPTSEAPNGLIQRGEAKLVTCLEDILDELGEVWKPLKLAGQQELPFEPQPAALQLEPIEQRIFDAMTTEPRTLDEICEQSQLPAGQVASVLTLLQLKGAIKQLPGGFFIRRSVE